MKLSWNNYITCDRQALAIHATRPEVNSIEHDHEFDELVIVDKGSGTHIINGRPLFIQAGDVFFVRHDDAHFYNDLRELSLTNLLCSADKPFNFIPSIHEVLRLSFPEQGDGRLWIDRQKKPQLSSCLEQLATHLTSTDPALSARREGLLLQTLSLLSRAAPVSGHRGTDSPHQVDRLLQYLRTHCVETIDWDWICQRFGISTRNLFRILKRETGLTPDAYVSRLRLSHARSLLLETDASITDVAYASGFVSLSYFCRLYRSAFSLSPSEQRKQAF